jgi:Ca-activated chloride channel family protein
VSPITFQDPERVQLLLGVLAVMGFLAWREVRGTTRLDRFLSRAMQARLVERPTRGRRALGLLLYGLALALGVLALMRPQSTGQSETIASREAGGEVMVLLDVSRSMLAEDAAPNRLERAKAEIRDLVRELPGQRVGLMAFAGRATVLCPLTPDHSFFRLVLDQASPRSVSRGGTKIGDAIKKALAGFRPGPSAKMILLVTDGDDHDSYALEAATDARAAGVRIVAIGFGDEKGAEIPIVDPKTGMRSPLKDRDGNVVRSKLDGGLLREIALKTEGAYVPAGTGVLDLESIVREYVTPFLARGGAEASRVVRTERYQGFVLGALVALVAAVVAGASSGPARERRRTAMAKETVS